MTKQKLMGLYQTKMNHIQLCYASLTLFVHEGMPRFFEELHNELDDDIKVFSNAVMLMEIKLACTLHLKNYISHHAGQQLKNSCH